jgi:hypothetical protein
MREAPAKEVLRRKWRHALALADDDLVAEIWAGPPTLSLDNRAELLRGIRATLSSEGFEIVSVFRFGLFQRARRDQLSGLEGVRALEVDEQGADTKQHWWLHEVVWGRPDTSIQVYARSDPDGNDLWLVGWGDQSVHRTMHELEALLLEHAPA